MTSGPPPLTQYATRQTPGATGHSLLVAPDHTGFDRARQAWNLSVDQRPAAVGLPRGTADVVALVEYAREQGLRIAPQATGHSASPLSLLSDTLLLRTSHMRSVMIDPVARTCRAEAGALWMDVTEPAADHGLAALAGSAPGVGVVGYTLGGGLGWLGRRFGLAANSVRGAEVVTADARVMSVDAENSSDLFWALRGGGGSYAIVTALEFDLFPVSEVYAGALLWPMSRASEVLSKWVEWLQHVPDELTSVGRLLRIPPLPDVPPPLQGRELVAIEAAYLGEREAGEHLLAPLRALTPELDTFATISPHELGRLHMDPPEPVPSYGDGMLLSGLGPTAIEELLDVGGARSPCRLLCIDLRHLGGALSREKFRAGVVSAIDAEFAVFAVGVTPDAASRQHAQRDIDRLQRALGRWDTGAMYLNFAERPRRADDLFGKGAHRLLQEIKATYDPRDLIQAGHSVRP